MYNRMCKHQINLIPKWTGPLVDTTDPSHLELTVWWFSVPLLAIGCPGRYMRQQISGALENTCKCLHQNKPMRDPGISLLILP